MNSSTIRSFAERLREPHQATSSEPLVALNPSGDRPPLFCVHPAGGNIICYRPLARHLPGRQPVYALASPHFDADRDPYAPIPEMASQYLELVRFRQGNGPYFLLGWSFGGIVAFEMAQQLLKQGERVGLLALLDTVAPLPFPYEFDDAVVLTSLTRELGFTHGKNLSVSVKALRELGRQEQLHHILDLMRSAGLVGEEVGPGWVSRLLQVYQSSLRVTHLYQPQTYPEQVTLFRTTDRTAEDQRFLREAFEPPPGAPFTSDSHQPNAMTTAGGSGALPGAGPENGNPGPLSWATDPTLGWARNCSRPVDVVYVPGSYLTSVSEPHVKALADRLGDLLERLSQARETQDVV